MENYESTLQRLYSPMQIATAAFLGSPIAACWFFASNFRQLSQPGNARLCLFLGSVGTVVLFVVSAFLPARFPQMVIPLGYTIALREAAKQIHGSTVTQHLSTGGRLGSWWSVVGISLFFLVGIFAVLFAGYSLFT